jgi:hypothetical protein
MAQAARDQVFRVREPFAVPSTSGPFMDVYPVDMLVNGADAVVRSHRAYLEPLRVEQATAAPGERRNLPLPSGVTVAQATAHRRGHAHDTGDKINMAHSLPPEDPNSPASPFAPFQPGAGVVADDVVDTQNPAGGTKAADYSGPSGNEAVLDAAEEKADADQNAVEQALAEGDAEKAGEVKDGGSSSSTAKKTTGKSDNK